MPKTRRFSLLSSSATLPAQSHKPDITASTYSHIHRRNRICERLSSLLRLCFRQVRPTWTCPISCSGIRASRCPHQPCHHRWYYRSSWNKGLSELCWTTCEVRCGWGKCFVALSNVFLCSQDFRSQKLIGIFMLNLCLLSHMSLKFVLLLKSGDGISMCTTARSSHLLLPEIFLRYFSQHGRHRRLSISGSVLRPLARIFT